MSKIQIDSKVQAASIDVHAQYTFTQECPDELPVISATEIVDELNQQAKLAKYRIGAKEAHNPQAIWLTSEGKLQYSKVEGQDVDIRWPAHAMVGTKGFEFLKGLPKIRDYDYFIWEGIELDMHPYGICYHDQSDNLSTGLIEFLRDKNITTTILGGLTTDYCIKVSALQLVKTGFKVIVNLGACRGIAENTVKQAMDEMKRAGVIFVNSANEIEPSP